MFLEKYKHTFNMEDTIFEKESIPNEPLFGKKDFKTKEYLTNKYNIKVKDICSVQKELEEILLKYKFINDYLESEITKIKTVSKKLDDEYMAINNSISIKGNAFLEMFELPNQYNYVFSPEIVYSKNVLEEDNFFIKSSEGIKEVDYYIEYINENSFFIHLDKFQKINSILLEFHNDVTYSLFGAVENGTLVNIFDKINSRSPLLLLNADKEYNKFYVISHDNITKYIKKIKIHNYSSESNNKYGYLFRKLDNLNNISNFVISNATDSEYYLFNEKEYNQIVLDLVNGENSNLINENNKINQNEDIKNVFTKDTMYLLEFFPASVNLSKKTKIYGKELEVK